MIVALAGAILVMDLAGTVMDLTEGGAGEGDCGGGD